MFRGNHYPFMEEGTWVDEKGFWPGGWTFPFRTIVLLKGFCLTELKSEYCLTQELPEASCPRIFYMKNRQLHSLPKFTSSCKAIMVGSGQCISVLFVIPIIVTIGTHTFEIFTTVCDIHDGMDLVFGMQKYDRN